jgi:L-ascorbate metabolism protein UlaG (beta-lactamase superfamily)
MRVTQLGALALEAAPRFWERYSQDRKRRIETAPFRPHPERWPAQGLHAAWIGHTTVLLRIDGFTILTDPVLHDRVGLALGPMTLGLKRLVHPALPAAAIPRPDIILLSHAHMDHFDIASLRSLRWPGTRVVTAKNTADLVPSNRWAGIDELGWGESLRIGNVAIRAFEVNHWGARMRTDTHRGFNGYTIETPHHRVLFGGDTALTQSFRELRSSRPFDLAIMPIGAYDPWIRAHCTPEQALRMASDAGAHYILPVHHQTFELSREPRREPIERLESALGSGIERLTIREIGQEFHIG